MTTTWVEARDLVVEGLGWPAEERAAFFDRLPARAEGIVNEHVWHLSTCSAGVTVRFQTDSPVIAVRWELAHPELSISRFAASGYSSVDLYRRRAGAESWRYVGTGLAETFPSNEADVATELDGEPAEYLLHLPLFNAVKRLEVGVAGGADVAPPPTAPHHGLPVVFYGTSIVQGASASRPGMTHVAQLQRRLARPFLNLGFAGNGQMHAELAPILAELEAAALVVDCLPNMNAALVGERGPGFLATLASAHPETPVLVAGSITYGGTVARPALAERLDAASRAQAEVVDRLRSAGHDNLRTVDLAGALGDDDEATVDTVHPSDLGFVRLADHFEPLLRKELGEN